MKLDNEKIIKYIEKNFPDLGKISSLSEIAHNNKNSKNFKINTKNGKFVLRNFQDGSNPKRIEEICKILNNCNKKGLKVVKPIINKNKKFVDEKNNLFLTIYYDGTFFQNTSKQIIELGKEIALLHKQLKNKKISKNKFKKNKHHIVTEKDIEKIIASIEKKKKLDNFDTKIKRDIKKIKEAIAINRLFENNSKLIKSKKQLIHHDLHPKNVIFNKNKIEAILDFNSLQYGQKYEDLSFAGYRFVMNKTSDIQDIKKKFRLFYKSYKKYNYVNIDSQFLLQSFIYETFRRISYIIKDKYFHNSNKWMFDYSKQMRFLSLAIKIVKENKS